MGESFSGFDASKYMYNGSNSNQFNNNNSQSSSLTNSDIDTFDFNGNNTDSTGNGAPSTIKLAEVDDFSGEKYGTKTIDQYFLQYGDVDGDGKITINDITVIQKYLNGSSNTDSILNLNLNNELITDFQNRMAYSRINNGIGDIDGDGKVTLMDVTLMQKYMTDKTFEPTNLTAVNRLDSLKYSSVQTEIGDQLTAKKEELSTIKNYIGQVETVNDIMIGPNTFSMNLRSQNSNPFDVNTGNVEDYKFFKNVFDGKVDISYSSLGDRLVDDPVSGNYSQELGEALAQRNNGLNGLERPNQNITKEEYKQQMVKKFVNYILYSKNNNSSGNIDPKKGLQDSACEYALKHAEEIVDYMLNYGSLDEAKASCQTNIAGLTYSKKQINKEMLLYPYENMMDTADFKKYANNITPDSFDPEKNDKLKNCSKYMDSYKYLDISQLTMYNYILNTSGEEEANKYLDAYEEDINEAKGLEMANKYLDMFDKDFSKIIKDDGTLMDEEDVSSAKALVESKKYDKKYDMNGDGKLDDEDITKLSQYVDAGGEILNTFDNLKISFGGGFCDGWTKFFEGFKYIGNDTANMSAEEYKLMFIAQKLEQNGIMSGAYEFGQTVGNMTPTILASAAATLATSYFGGEGGVAVLGATLSAEEVGQITAGILIFSSTYGLEKHNALVKGHDIETAMGYGFLSGLSEAGLETLLGSLPYVGKECSNVFTSMFKEGLSESAQAFVGAMLGEYMLGEEIDITNLSAEMSKSFIYGALLSGAGYAGKACIEVTISDIKYTLTTKDIMGFYDASIDPVTGENNGLTLQEYVQKNVESSGYSDPNNLDIDGLETTAELPKLDPDGIETTAELPKLDTDDSSGDYYSQPVLNSSPEFNALEMENEINSCVTPDMTIYQKVRTLYIELNKRLSYNADYLNGSTDTKSDIYNTELSFENLKDANVVCKGWSELYRELLIDNGFDPDSVRIVSDGKTIGHRWVEVTLPDGNIIIADGTETMGTGSGRGNDLANCKIGAATNGFVYVPSSYSGQRIKTNPDLIQASNTQWADIDNSLGYNSDGLYYDDIIAQANDFFTSRGKSKSYSKKVKALEDIKIPDGLDGVETVLYYRKLKHTFFNDSEVGNIDVRINYNKVGNSFEGVAIVEIKLDNGGKQYITYSESTGKHVFKSQTDYYAFLSTLKYS